MRRLIALSIASVLSVLSAGAQTLLTEDFPFGEGDTLTSAGWNTNQSTVTNALLVTTPGLTYPNHPGSGVGNAVQLLPSGQDAYRQFEPVSDGSLYVVLMIRVQEASTGDYVIHLQSSPQSTSYFARLFVRHALNDALAFGIAKRGTNASPTHVYSDSVYALNTTCCLVLKYRFNQNSSTDDDASLFVFAGSPLPSWEPAAPTVGPVTDQTNDAPALSVVTLRQGDASRAPTLLMDGIRICTSWEACLPVAIHDLAAVVLPGSIVRVSWTTPSEVNCYGFTVQRGKDEAGMADIPGAFLPGQGTCLTPTHYAYHDTVLSGGAWHYRLRQTDLDGSDHFSETIAVNLTTGVNAPLLRGLRFDPVYPNPFNASSTIEFSIPIPSRVEVDVFNSIGGFMGRLVDGNLEAGEYSVPMEVEDWPGGVYFCRIRAGGMERVQRMILVR